jgi:hypothetical protein
MNDGNRPTERKVCVYAVIIELDMEIVEPFLL